MEKRSNILKFFLSAAAVWGLAYLLYVPGLSGPFLFDDFQNLEPLGYFGGVTDMHSALRFVFGNDSGPTGRPVSMASFLLNDAAWPSNPFYFKQTNLLLHLACGLAALLVLSRLVTTQGGDRRFARPPWLCLAVIGLWLLHPINLSTVLYPIQRMAILSAFFSMMALYFYLSFRESFFDKKVIFQAWFFLFFVVFFVLGVFSKENAVLLIPFIVFLEVFYFDRSILIRVKFFLRNNIFLMALLCVLVVFVSSGWWAQGYERRDFGLYERVRYQVPIVGDYALKILLPRVSGFNLFSGDYENISARAFTYVDYLRSVVTIFLLIALVMSIFRKYWISVLGLSWFFVFHIFESTFYPLETYFEHRNYLPSIGLILFIVSAVGTLFKKSSHYVFLRRGVLVAVIGYLSSSLLLLSLTWATPDMLFLKWEMDEPKSARAKVFYAVIMERKGFPENSIEHIERAIELRPDAIGLHLMKLRLICQFGLENSVDEALTSFSDANHFDFGVVHATESLMALDEDNNGLVCENSGYPVHLRWVLAHIENADATVWGAVRTARYYSLKSDFFARSGNLNSSVEAIDKAIEYTPTVDVYLKKTVMLASAGLSDAALKALESAEAADKSRPAFYPSRMAEILQLRKRIESHY